VFVRISSRPLNIIREVHPTSFRIHVTNINLVIVLLEVPSHPTSCINCRTSPAVLNPHHSKNTNPRGLAQPNPSHAHDYRVSTRLIVHNLHVLSIRSTTMHRSFPSLSFRSDSFTMASACRHLTSNIYSMHTRSLTS